MILFIKCIHDYYTVEESSAFILHSVMKDLKDFTLGNTVFHTVSSHQREIESHAVLGHGTIVIMVSFLAQ